jgi:hypothetical protein
MIDPTKADVRTAHRHIQKERLAKADHDRHLAELPDLTAQAVFVDYERAFREEKAADQRRAVEES